MSTNPIVDIAARAIELLAGGSLDYRDGRNGHHSRVEAGAALLDADAVRETGAPGYYRVRSEETARRFYSVCALPGELSCECDDSLRSKNNPTGLCKHILAAVLYHAAREVLAELEPEADDVPPVADDDSETLEAVIAALYGAA
jgi:hypothetical protein